MEPHDNPRMNPAMPKRTFSIALRLICSFSRFLLSADIQLLQIGTGWQSQAFGISADGNKIVGMGDFGDGLPLVSAFIKSSGSNAVELPTPVGFYRTYAYGISADGSTTVGIFGMYGGDLNVSKPAVWRGNTVIDIGSISGSSASGYANGVSADGNVIVGVSGDHAFKWTQQDGMIDLGLGTANAVSGDGGIIVGSNSKGAFYWTASEGMVKFLGPQSSSDSYSISSNGEYIVGTFAGNGFLWSKSEGVKLVGKFGANAVSGDGKIVIGDNFLWNGFANTSLDLLSFLKSINVNGLEGLSRLTPTAITGDNTLGYRIVGWGIVSGRKQAFLISGLTFSVPEPSSYVMAVIMALTIASLKNRIIS